MSPGLPDGLVITPSLAAALDHAETEITRRLRLLDAGEDSPPPLALIAQPDAAAAPRIRAILDAGVSVGITGILLGDWPSGITCHIGAGGEVTEAGDTGLAGIWASHLTATDTAAMLSMLRGAQGHLADDQPRPPGARPGQDAGAGAVAGEPGRAPQPGPGGVTTGEGDPGDASPGAPGPGSLPAGRSPRSGPAPAESPGAMAPQPEGGTPATQRGTLAGSTAPAASLVITASPPSTAKPVLISVLGRLRITARGQEISGGLRKARELLAYLAVNPQGVTGEGIGEALWPESNSRYAASQRYLAMRKAREMLRTATGLRAPMFIVLAAERYRLDPSLIEVDLWQFDAALDRAREAASGQDQLAALRQAISLYQGPLSDGAAYEWAERHAEPARRRAVDALARAADILQPGDPEQALTTLETALTHDPYNEALYQKIMDIQARLGRPDAARRTLALLESRLAAIGLAPSAETRHSL